MVENSLFRGFFFEMTQALCAAIMYIGFGDYADAIKYLKRFKVLVRSSGLFKEIRPSELIGYRDRESFIKLNICKFEKIWVIQGFI